MELPSESCARKMCSVARAAFDIDISAIGDRELAAALHSLPGEIQKKLVRRHMRNAMRPILRAIRDRLPVQPSKHGGEKTEPIKELMTIRARRFKDRNKFGINTVLPSRIDLGIPPNHKYYYPAAIELGTSKTPAKPFVRPAFRQNTSVAIAVLTQGIRYDVNREMAKLAAKKFGEVETG